MSTRSSGFPFHPLRMVTAVLAWNALILADRELLGFPFGGPLSLVALASLAAISFTAPSLNYPGKWILRRTDFARRWRWVFWYVGALAVGFCVIIAVEFVRPGSLLSSVH